MGEGLSAALWLAAAVVALLVVRALVAALQSALVAVGQPRANQLASEAPPRRRARALEALVAEPEATAAGLHVLDALAALGAGALAGTAAWWAAGTGAASAPAVLAGAALSLLLSAAARSLGARHAEPVALGLAVPARAIRWALAPIGRALATAARPLAGRPGRFAQPLPPLEEMERAMAEAARSRGGPAAQARSELIRNVIEFGEKVARDVMVPRTEVVAIDVETPVPEILRILAEEGHSRLPVYRESLDHVVGTLHARDLVPLLENPRLIVLQDLIRPPAFVPWSKPIDQLLREMQRRHVHMVVVVDEYGGVMGISTLEDVLEEIVGDIADEFDAEQGKAVEAHADGTFTVRGDTPVSEFNRVAGAAIPEKGNYETLGGFLNALAGAIPAAGERLSYRGWTFTVSEASPRRVHRVRAARAKRQTLA